MSTFIKKIVYLCNLILIHNNKVVLENCVIISYYKDHHVWRHCQYIELISTAPSKNSILLMKYFKIGVCAIAANYFLSNLHDIYVCRQFNYQANCCLSFRNQQVLQKLDADTVDPNSN